MVMWKAFFGMGNNKIGSWDFVYLVKSFLLDFVFDYFNGTWFWNNFYAF
jgi:hypothetical protein